MPRRAVATREALVERDQAALGEATVDRRGILEPEAVRAGRDLEEGGAFFGGELREGRHAERTVVGQFN